MILELNNMRIKPLNVRKKVTWYNRLPTNGYRTPKKGYGIITLFLYA